MGNRQITKRERELHREIDIIKYVNPDNKFRAKNTNIDYSLLIKKYEELITIAPKKGYYYLGLAEANKNIGNLKTAIEVAERGIKQDPLYKTNAMAVAEYLKEDGQDEEALIKFKECLRMKLDKDDKEFIQKNITELEEIINKK